MPHQIGMTHKDMVEDAARLLQAQGERVTYRAVLKRIERTHGRGLSMRDVVEPLSAWKARNRYEYSHLEAARLPERLERLLATFGREVLDFALAQAEGDLRAEREDIAFERRELARYRDALLSEIKALERDKADLKRTIREMREGARGRRDWQVAIEVREAGERALEERERLQRRADDAERIADGLALAGIEPPRPEQTEAVADEVREAAPEGAPRGDGFDGFFREMVQIAAARRAGQPVRPPRPEQMTPRRFWDWVMREIVAQMDVHGAMSGVEILNALPADVLQEARDRGEPLDAGRLERKLAIRVAAGLYFVRLEDGRYALRGR